MSWFLCDCTAQHMGGIRGGHATKQINVDGGGYATIRAGNKVVAKPHTHTVTRHLPAQQSMAPPQHRPPERCGGRQGLHDWPPPVPPGSGRQGGGMGVGGEGGPCLVAAGGSRGSPWRWLGWLGWLMAVGWRLGLVGPALYRWRGGGVWRWGGKKGTTAGRCCASTLLSCPRGIGSRRGADQHLHTLMQLAGRCGEKSVCVLCQQVVVAVAAPRWKCQHLLLLPQPQACMVVGCARCCMFEWTPTAYCHKERVALIMPVDGAAWLQLQCMVQGAHMTSSFEQKFARNPWAHAAPRLPSASLLVARQSRTDACSIQGELTDGFTTASVKHTNVFHRRNQVCAL